MGSQKRSEARFCFLFDFVANFSAAKGRNYNQSFQYLSLQVPQFTKCMFLVRIRQSPTPPAEGQVQTASTDEAPVDSGDTNVTPTKSQRYRFLVPWFGESC